MHAAQRYKKQFDECQEREKQLQAKVTVLENRIAEDATCKKVGMIITKNLYHKLPV